MSRLTVGVVQHACGERRGDNLAASERGIRDAAAGGAEVVLLPELHTLRYFCQTEDVKAFDLAEPVPGPTTRALGELARALGVVIVGSVFERRAPGLHHNAAVVLDRSGDIAGLYRKMHVPDDPGFQEKFYFAPGDRGFTPIDTTAGRLGVLVCWDQWYPEAARLMALAGARVLLFPSAIGWSPGDDAAERQRQREAWITMQRAHAIANGLHVVAANRTGLEPDPSGATGGIEFWGSSFVAGPQGEVIVMAGEHGSQVIVADLDMAHAEDVRRIWPYLRDRRIDAYEGLLRRYLD
jgi:N-carbamoylputrescine amidase